MSKQSSLGRVLGIISDLNSGRKLNVKLLAEEYEVSPRTIRRDIELIEESFKENFVQKDGENIYSIQKDMFNNLLSGMELASLIQILNVFEYSGVNLKLDIHTRKLVDEHSKIYDITNKPFENFNDVNILRAVEKGIKQSKELDIIYKTKNGTKEIKYKPYKITMLNENFYLLGVTSEGFVNLRIGMIKSVVTTSKVFYKTAEMITFINNVQTPFSNFGCEAQVIKIEVKSEVAKYWKMKSFYKSQKILEEKKDGSLIVSYEMTNYREISDFIIQWIPNIKILEPLGFREHIRKKIANKLCNV